MTRVVVFNTVVHLIDPTLQLCVCVCVYSTAGNIDSPPTLDSHVAVVYRYVSLGGPQDNRCHGEHAPWLSMSRQSCRQGGTENSEDLG